jgi:predicted ATP-dependent endonuclease of OLD family
MFFNKFTIKDYKCFKGEQSLLFAIPEEGKFGSGMAYIVGGNNSGKTTLIEGLSIKDKRNIKTSERINGADPEFYLYENDVVVRKNTLIRTESSTIKEDPQLDTKDTFEIISSRRHWTSTANNNYSQLGESFASVLEFANRQNNLEVASELRTIEADNTKYKEFIKLVQRVIPEFTKFAVAYEDNHYIEYISNSGIRHKTELLGDGVITVIRILLQLYVAKPNPIIIDEPELSLHPSAQRKLLKVLAEYSQKRQIVISTHSPYMVNWEYLKNGAVINRVVKEEDKYSHVFSILDFTKYDQLISSDNWKMPFAMDEVAKEIFFMEDGVLFLEGQEDVGLLKKEPVIKNVNIFGYGVRGKDNFKFALTLAQDLGFKKVSCILDGGESEKKIKEDLESIFSEYKIIQWNKNDIRDKKVYSSAEKEGYFDEDGKKKAEAELDDYDSKLKEVKDYLVP